MYMYTRIHDFFTVGRVIDNCTNCTLCTRTYIRVQDALNVLQVYGLQQIGSLRYKTKLASYLKAYCSHKLSLKITFRSTTTAKVILANYYSKICREVQENLQHICSPFLFFTVKNVKINIEKHFFKSFCSPHGVAFPLYPEIF